MNGDLKDADYGETEARVLAHYGVVMDEASVLPPSDVLDGLVRGQAEAARRYAEKIREHREQWIRQFVARTNPVLPVRYKSFKDYLRSTAAALPETVR